MSDQAQGLRALVDQARREQSNYSSESTATAALPARTGGRPADTECVVTQYRNPRVVQAAPARVIAVTSGKGGVGKTNFSTNVSLCMQMSGKRVIVLDADLGLANLHVVMGITPQYHLEHVMRGEKTIREILCPGPCGIRIVAGGSGIAELANLDEDQRQGFLAGLKELDSLADVIVIDTGAGLSRNVMAFLCAVDEIVVITTPEPTAITDAYATIKVVSQENPGARLMLMVNMAQHEAEADAVFNRMFMIARKFLGVELEYLGFIPQDPMVSRAVRGQQPFILSQPQSQAARAVHRIADSMCLQEPTSAPPAGVENFLSRVQRFFGLAAPARYR